MSSSCITLTQTPKVHCSEAGRPVATRSDSGVVGESICVVPLDCAGLAPDGSMARSEWRRLCDADSATRITQHPDYVSTELRGMQHRQGLPASLLVGARSADGWTSLAVLVPKAIPIHWIPKLPFSGALNGWRLAGNRILGDSCRETYERLLDATLLEMRRYNAQVLLVEDLERDSVLSKAIQSRAERQAHILAPSGFQERLRIHFPDNPDEYWSKFSSKTRNTFRRKIKKMGDVDFAIVKQADQVASFLHEAHQVSLKSWQTRQLGLRVRNDQAERELFTFLAQSGALRSYLLSKQGRPIAFLIGTQFKGCFNYEEVGFDRSFADASPGQVLLLKVLEDLLADDTPEWFDFGGGDAGYKRLFATHRSESGNVWLMPPTWRSRTTTGFLAVRRAGGRVTRNLLRSAGLMTRVRQWTRRGFNKH